MTEAFEKPAWAGRAAVVLPAAALSGALIALALSPFHWSWLTLLSPAALFYLVAAAPRRLAPWVGYVYGVGYFGAGGHWIYYSVGEFGGGPLVALVFCAALAAAFGLLIWALVHLWLRVRPQAALPAVTVALPTCWMAVEWVRSWLFTGTTWLQLGYAHVDNWLGGYAPIIGALGISMLVSVLAGLIAWAALVRRRKPAIVAVVAVVVVWLIGGVMQRDWTSPAAEPLQIALLQGNVPQDQKWLPENRQRQLDLYERLTSRFWGADVVIWPETAIPAFQHQVSREFLAPLLADAEDYGTDVLVGLPSWDSETRAVYNTVLALGQEVDVYHKRHLVPFGEYVPFRRYLGAALDVFGAPMADFTPGWTAGPLMVGGQPMAISICYEITFPNEVRDFLPEATVLVNVSNDAWFGTSIGPHQHFQMARMRALEMGRPLVRATNTGITASVDHRGQVIARVPQFTVDALLTEVTPHEGVTPYMWWGNWPVLVLLFAALGVCGVMRYGLRR
ncbi:apolipoprotein N-acyltransferase [Natronocella acetinitrilica]|uniref:Apolipoprotein N-acyltransferase n=1 Tax=Natronocella acetinitrilica TaxID=414046 RepID=A0AAE3G199_9GAMM|nr:apolipoprotein N-acyltransferase [Natronocella acetinitrilica]MCP1673945.1 apolipoprotein N-acyltransferase [Natronocella acetinitrilica]